MFILSTVNYTVGMLKGIFNGIHCPNTDIFYCPNTDIYRWSCPNSDNELLYTYMYKGQKFAEISANLFYSGCFKLLYCLRVVVYWCRGCGDKPTQVG